MDDIWRHNNKLREFQEWAIITNSEALENSGIYDLLKETYSRDVADIFAKMVDSDEYKASSYDLQYDVSVGPQTAEISSMLHPYEYVRLFKEVHNQDSYAIKFYSQAGTSNILSARYLRQSLANLKVTKDNIIFLGKGGHPMSHVNQNEYIEYL